MLKRATSKANEIARVAVVLYREIAVSALRLVPGQS